MRRLKVASLILLLALPLMADDNAGIPIVGPEQDENEGCVECGRVWDDIICGGEPTAAGWINCEGGWIWLCDGYAGCTREPNCGDRCAIA